MQSENQRVPHAQFHIRESARRGCNYATVECFDYETDAVTRARN